MDLAFIFKELATYGFTIPTIVGLKILWQINKKFVNHDRRISVLEALQKRRVSD